MSVIKNKRSLSRLEFYHNARTLRKEITELLRRDFGIHSRRNAKKIDPSLPEDYYEEDIKYFASSIRTLLRNLMWHITAGNTIFPTKLSELDQRRYHQNEAIIACEQLHQEFLFCEDAMPIKVSVFMPYLDRILFQQKLLKGWRKSNSKFEASIRSKTKEGTTEHSDTDDGD
jgi:hypothetical protein